MDAFISISYFNFTFLQNAHVHKYDIP